MQIHLNLYVALYHHYHSDNSASLTDSYMIYTLSSLFIQGQKDKRGSQEVKGWDIYELKKGSRFTNIEFSCSYIFL